MEKDKVVNQYKRWLISRIFSLIANCPILHDKKFDVELTYRGFKESFIIEGVSFFEDPGLFLSKIGININSDLSVLEREKISSFCEEIKLAGNSNNAIRSTCAMAGNISNSFNFY